MGGRRQKALKTANLLPCKEGSLNVKQEWASCCCCKVASDSVRPHRQQPSRLPCPWDSPGKNTGVGSQFLLQFMKMKSESEVAQSCPALSDLMDCSLPGSSIHGIFQARVLEWGAIAFSVIVRLDSVFSGRTGLKVVSPFYLKLPLCLLHVHHQTS